MYNSNTPFNDPTEEQAAFWARPSAGRAVINSVWKMERGIAHPTKCQGLLLSPA